MEYLIHYEDGSSGYLQHHGVKGMKWGVWNEETKARHDGSKPSNFYKEGGVLPKGYTVSRVALTKSDPTYGNKKYVSISKKDHKKWEKYLGENYSNRGRATFNLMYQTNKDLKIASDKELGKYYTEKIMGSKYAGKALSELKDAHSKLGAKGEKVDKLTPSEAASYHLAMQTETGKRVIDGMLKSGYGGVSDSHGRNTAKDPLIIFDPDTNLTRTDYVDFTKPTKKLLKTYKIKSDPNDSRWT